MEQNDRMVNFLKGENPTTNYKERNWILTISKSAWNNGPPSQLPKGVRYMCGQLEKGENTGFLHYQVYASFLNSVRRSTIQSILKCGKAWCMPVKKPLWAYNYCMKDDPTFVGERFELGIQDKRLIRIKDYKPKKGKEKEKEKELNEDWPVRKILKRILVDLNYGANIAEYIKTKDPKVLGIHWKK